ncbi:MAG: hypothetical protein H0X51_08800 [Parachlamydiaceae bacterium]|nr:hypothetical protein [Parachlamydiaceae bacterium]
MSYTTIGYGSREQADYSSFCGAIATCISQKDYAKVEKDINRAFFKGEAFQAKSFTQIFSITVPTCSKGTSPDNHSYVEIKGRYSFTGVLGFLEGIPILGSAIAVILCIGHCFGLMEASSNLETAVKHYGQITSDKISRGIENTEENDRVMHQIFENAVAYTVHQNRLISSIISLIPFVKPATRIAQGIAYHCSKQKND